ncbi:Uncharacterised protein [Chromobacterium violaceum]|uniref:Uncharacterized protein n=1 Tax=Chromobacterium violaceum TaxID=536 RepID=A0A447TI58_CHRVL|nr:Uncharacterised protein [Chromobacterium violaceum]
MAMLFPLLAVLIWAANTIVSKAAAQVLDRRRSRFTAGCWRRWC